jgi:subtilisin family serine protease
MDRRRREGNTVSRFANGWPAWSAVALLLLVALGVFLAAGVATSDDLVRANDESAAATADGATATISRGDQRIAVRLAPGTHLVENADGTLSVSQDWATSGVATVSTTGLPLEQTDRIESLGIQVLGPVRTASFSSGASLVAASSPCCVDLEEAARALRLMPGVLWAEVSQPIYACMVPNDPYYARSSSSTGQWGMPRVGFPEAWDITTGASDVTVAVIDTGLNKDIADFSNRIVSPYNVLTQDANWPAWEDTNGHGSAVAGVAAAQGDNGSGIAGAAWDVKIMPVKISADGSSTDLTLAEGIEYAVNNGADVINVSFASPPGTGYSYALSAAVTYAYGQGVLIVAAAGNDADTVGYPAAFPSVIAVGATESSDALSAYSNTGDSIDVVAPGSQIISYGLLSPSPSGLYSWYGTSVAAPLVTGVIALMLSIEPSLTPGQITDILGYTADDLGASGRDNKFGWGLLDADEAVAEVAGGGATTTTEAPTTTTTTTEAPSTTTTTTAPGSTTTTDLHFVDVSEGSTPYWQEIDYLASLGIVSGSDDGLFLPNDTLKRQQFAKIIVLALGYPVTGSEVCPFKDVAAQIGDDPFYPYSYVAVAYQQGVVKGTDSTHFSPYRSLTRSQMISMVARAADLTEPPAGYTPPFSNFSAEHYPYARQAAYAGLLDGLVGMGPGYRFTSPASRGEMCALLYALLQ